MKTKQGGIAVIEFTIVAPFFLLIIFVTAEFGRLIYQYSELTRMARSAGRYLQNTAIIDTTGTLPATLDDTNCDYCITKMKRMLLGGKTIESTSSLAGLHTSDITVTKDPVNEGVLLVSVSYDWTPMLLNSLHTYSYSNDIDLSFNISTHYSVTAL